MAAQNPLDIGIANAEYIERVYSDYASAPAKVDTQWRSFFQAAESAPLLALGREGEASASEVHVEVANLVHAYRELGHFTARLDPLGNQRPEHPLLALGEYGLNDNYLHQQVGSGGFVGRTDGTLADLLARLQQTYCGSVGVEYTHIADGAQRQWLEDRIEPTLNQPAFSADEKRDLLSQLCQAQGFEEFLHTRFIGQKRFSAEGAEAMVPLLNWIADDGAEHGVDELVIGMAHRGRLNVLAHVVGKPLELMLAEFAGILPHAEHEGSGDVKYHLGFSGTRNTRNGKAVHMALSFNPSHLELVDPVVEGIVRAKQYYLDDTQRTRVVPLLIHGDAAFCGQGIVQETLALSEMPYWRTGGTVHVIVNNQIGFTTMPKQGRFTAYPTDVAKSIQAPIFHVNGDDVEAVAHVARLAIAFRQQFHTDVMIDLWCYRRHGHNETDEPTFTQPVMYRQIGEHATVRELYAHKLIDEGVLRSDDFDAMKHAVVARLDQAQAASKDQAPQQVMPPFGGVWKGLDAPGSDWSAKTQVTRETIAYIGEAATRVPDGFEVHPKLRKTLQNRREMSKGLMPIDWGTGEMFALGSLLLEGTPIRFVGQDVQRGTFSHRHASLHDYRTGAKYFPLANLSDKQAPFIIVNTMLSELAVLGFEYGFATADPRNLIVWEAQFGDFVNGAQPIMDQCIAAGEAKWRKSCGLVMLLPHGYEGQGPEHSNSYVERFLQLCAENNIQVCMPTLPSQHFHLLRRQMRRNFRKPLICFTPKSLLRAEFATSQISEFTDRSFQVVLDDPSEPKRERVKRILLCSGKVFYTLDAARKKKELAEVALIRVEQLYPFPQKEIQQIIAKYNSGEEVQEIAWVQEEPKNRGAWSFMEPRLRPLLPDVAVLSYYGRPEAASPAVGSYADHVKQEQLFVAHALELPQGRLPAKTSMAREAARHATPVSD
jgi:2-oxoglutarate dehydrogenase E1 component